MLTETAFAKVNLALHVRRRRDDGYHDIESLFAFVDSGDVLRGEVRDDGLVTLTIDGPFATGLDDGPDNLVLRAARALRHSVFPIDVEGPLRDGLETSLDFARDRRGGGGGADLYLTKNLPVASGIGGGSADAAAALRLLNTLWGCGLDDRALCAIAETLGSDIPACVISRTLRVESRGEALAPLDLAGLSGTPILLVNPAVPLSTGPVFQAWDRIDQGSLDTSSLDAIVQHGRNDLETPARGLVAQIGDVLDSLAQQSGVTLARMSGSGATCFALFDSVASAQAARQALTSAHPQWWAMLGHVR